MLSGDMIRDTLLERYLTLHCSPVFFFLDSVPIQAREDLQCFRWAVANVIAVESTAEFINLTSGASHFQRALASLELQLRSLAS